MTTRRPVSPPPPSSANRPAGAPRTRGLRIAALLSTAVLLAGCGGYAETTVPKPAQQTTEPAAAVPPECENDGSQLRSYAPGDITAAQAQQDLTSPGRDKLVAGIAADTLLLAARNPATGQIEGFDIDFVYAVAQDLFGVSPEEARSRVVLKVITAAERIPLLQDRQIDIVVRNMTINCSRWQQVAFSAEYYRAGQKVLVGKDAGVDSIEDLSGKRICAPGGTTSIENIANLKKIAADTGLGNLKSAPIPVTAGDNSECMILFQNGEADGVSTDDTVLAGLAAQDPYAEVLDTQFLTQEPYGIAVGPGNTRLARFVNRTMERMRDDGRWQASYDTWLKPYLGKGTQPQPVYGR